MRNDKIDISNLPNKKKKFERDAHAENLFMLQNIESSIVKDFAKLEPVLYPAKKKNTL